MAYNHISLLPKLEGDVAEHTAAGGVAVSPVLGTEALHKPGALGGAEEREASDFLLEVVALNKRKRG